MRVETLESRELLAADLVISELVASNAGSLQDADGDSPDWIELYNPSDAPVDLFGWSLTDDADNLTKWKFPEIRLEPQSYLVVFASGKDRATETFRLSSDYNAVTQGTFLVDLPDGQYEVRVGMGDAGKTREEAVVSLQGEVVETLTIPVGSYFTGTYRTAVSAETGGQLALRIEDLGGATPRSVINSLVVTPLGGGGEALRFDFGTSSSPVQAGYAPVTAADTYQSAVGYGWRADSNVKDRDRGVDRDELHTNFKLSSRGEFLALVHPDGETIAYQFAPNYPAQRLGVSYGLEQQVVASTPIAVGDQVRWLVPTPENGGTALGTTWTDPDFDDSGWAEGPTGIGFAQGTSPEIEALVATDIGQEMKGVTGSAFLRLPFTVSDPDMVFSLVLKMKYDDGYAAFLNGTEIASANRPSVLRADSIAENPRPDLSAKEFEEIDVSQYTHLLREGTNILAIQGLNRNPTNDNFFLIVPQLDMLQSRPIEDPSPRFFATPTPAAPNGIVSFGGLALRPTVDTPGGLFEDPIDITIEADTPGGTLIVTTDGTRPSLENGTQYPADGPQATPSTTLTISGTTVVRAVSVKEDYLASRVESRTYIFPGDIHAQTFQATVDAGFPPTWGGPEAFPIRADYGLDPKIVGPDDLFDGKFASQLEGALRAVPSISMVTDFDNLFGPDGILDSANSNLSGLAGERLTSVELINPDGTPGFQIDAGVRIQGDASRNYSNSRKRSFRFAFRKQYGAPSLVYPLFGDGATDTFNTIRLRANYNDGSVHTPLSTQHIRDEWMRRTLLAMEDPNPHGTFMHLYINGFYWGLYNVVERPDGAFSETYFGGDKDQWDTISANRPKNGSIAAWGDLSRESAKVAASDPAASNAAYQRLLGNNPDGTNNPNLETLLDVDNYIDYLIVNFYGGNTDWPGRNYYAGRLRGPESTGFKFFSWDAEKVLGHEEGSTVFANRTGESGDVARFYAALRKNAEFRLRFADRVQKHFFNGGALYVDPENPAWDPAHPERNVPAARYDELARFVELPLVAEYARWGDTTRRGADQLPDGSSRLVTPDTWAAFRDGLFADYFPRRSAIVLDQLREAGLFPSVDAPVFNQHGGPIDANFRLTMTGQGEIYYTLDGSDPRRSAFEGEVGVRETAIRYTGPISLEPGAHVKARVLLDGQWSALAEAAFGEETPRLRISEIMYNPAGNPDDPATDNDAYEFIELVNTSATTSMDLENVAFTRGIEFTFPAMELGPGQRVLVVADRTAFEERYGTELPVAGEYTGFRLSNGGETLRLEDASGQLIQELRYRDSWYRSTDGGGFSLEVLDASRDDADLFNRAEAYLPSIAVGGTPGADRASAPIAPGDANLDGKLDSDDIRLFALGLTDPGAYRDRFGVPAELAGDTDGDGDLDYDDIAAFAALIASDTASAATGRDAIEPRRARPTDRVDRYFHQLGRSDRRSAKRGDHRLEAFDRGAAADSLRRDSDDGQRG